MRFEFATAQRILFGPGTLNELYGEVPKLGRKAVLITGKNVQRASVCIQLLRDAGVESEVLSFSGEPTIELLRSFKERITNVNVVIGFGGGSAIDMAKAIAALAVNAGDPLDYIEVIGKGKPLSEAPLPCVAIPTTAGSGAEATRNAVLTSTEHRAKASLRSPSMLPRLAIVDPKLMLELPPALTASTGLDALTQLIEPYVCSRANPITDGLCIEGMKRIKHALRRAVENGTDLEAREDMALASLFGGVALANAGLGAVHGFAAPIGGMFPHAPHGAVCAALLPGAMEVNLKALQERAPEHPAVTRYGEVARILTGLPHADTLDGVRWVQSLVKDLRIPSLRAYGVGEAHIDELCQKARAASSMKANPIELRQDELREILNAAL